MKTILEIAKNELKTLFYSPIAWLIFIIFAFQTGFEFSKVFDSYVQYKASGGALFELTERVFTANPSGLLLKIQRYLYLYIPLLTMGLMSREYFDGTVKLLYSSPVRNSQIIIGKYLAITVFSLVLILIVIAYVIFGLFTIKELDIAFLFWGLLGLFLLTCAYCAVGLFMSTLTSYQVVAAMTTLATLTFLNYVGAWWQDIPVLSDIAYWLSIRGRSTQIIQGLMVSEDVFYFIIVSTLFIVLSTLYLQGKRSTRRLSVSILKYSAVVILVITCGYISTLPVLKAYFDTTKTQKCTLLPSHQDAFNRLGDRITLTAYVNIFDQNIGYGAPDAVYGLPKDKNNMKTRFALYTRFRPRTKFKYVYYYMPTSAHGNMQVRFPNMTDRQRAEELARILGLNMKKILSPEQIREKIDLSAEDWNLLWIIEDSNGGKEILRTFHDMSKLPGTDHISPAYKRLSGITTRIGVITGHGERNIYGNHSRNYSSLLTEKNLNRTALVNSGFDFIPINLASNKEIPDEIDMLMIADPRREIPENELKVIAEYLDRGGNALFLGEPGRQKYINPVLSLVGMELSPGRLVQKTADYDQTLIQGKPAPDIIHWCARRLRWMLRWRYKHLMTSAAEVEQISPMGFDLKRLVVTDSLSCWNELVTTDFHSEEAVLNPEEGEMERSYAVAQALEKKIEGKDRSQRIIIFGDADWMSNEGFGIRKQGINTDNSIIMIEMFKWLTHDDYPLPRDREDRLRTQDDDINVNPDRMPMINLFLTCFLPIAMAVWFSIIWLLRKKK